jgi:outer membrane lipoprotein-sorting protein
LIPKPGVQAPFKRQELWVNHQTWLPIKVELTEKNNDVTWIRFGNMQQNISLSNSFFSVKPQPGTKVING